MRLEDLVPDSVVQDIVPGVGVSVRSVTWHGDSVTVVYRTPDGGWGERLLYRSDESSLVKGLADQRPFTALAEDFKLAAEAQRIKMAGIFDPMIAVTTSDVQPLPHQITAVYQEMLPRSDRLAKRRLDILNGVTVSQYPYMPRLCSRTVLERGLTDMPMLWQMDAFALALGHDETTGRYTGLWIPDSGDTPPVITDSTLLVRPDLAAAQDAEDRATLARDKQQHAPHATDDASATHTPVATPPVQPLSGGGATAPVVRPKTRFYGQTALNPDKVALEFKQISDEILSHLRDNPSTRISIHLEIEATEPSGFTDAQVRTVSENATVLKFEQFGFEEN